MSPNAAAFVEIAKVAVVRPYLARRAVLRIMKFRYVSARHHSQEGRQSTVTSAPNKRVSRDRVQQRHVLYLGRLVAGTGTLSLSPEDRCEGIAPDDSIVRLKLSHLRLERPRTWGGCWLALTVAAGSSSTSSGRRGYRRAARARAGTRCLSSWWCTGCCRREVSGGCTGSGLTAAHWPIFWALIVRWPTFTRCTPVMTNCSHTSGRCSITWWIAGDRGAVRQGAPDLADGSRVPRRPCSRRCAAATRRCNTW